MPTPSQTAADKAVQKTVEAKVEPRVLTVQGEADRLWRHVLFGTGTCIGMLEGYAKLGVPGDPVPEMRNMVCRLQTLIEKLEPNAVHDSANE